MRITSKHLLALIFVLLTAPNSFAEEAFQFPNGIFIKLKESEVANIHDEYRLVDADGHIPTEFDIEYADSYREYVYGSGLYCPNATKGEDGYVCSESFFLYKKGDRGMMIFENSSDFKLHLAESNFPKWSRRNAIFDGEGRHKKRYEPDCFGHDPSSTTPHIKLPNGLYLVHDLSAACSYDNYLLTDENFEPAIQPHVRYAGWYGDYVYGYAYNYRGKDRNPHYHLVGFIYKKGDKDAMYLENIFELEKHLKLIGLPEWNHDVIKFKPIFDSSEFRHKYRKPLKDSLN